MEVLLLFVIFSCLFKLKIMKKSHQMSSRVMTKLLIMMRTKTTVSKYLFSINLEQRRNTFTGPPLSQVPNFF